MIAATNVRSQPFWFIEAFLEATQNYTSAAAALTAVDEDGCVKVQNPASVALYGHLAEGVAPGSTAVEANFWELLFCEEPVGRGRVGVGGHKGVGLWKYNGEGVVLVVWGDLGVSQGGFGASGAIIVGR